MALVLSSLGGGNVYVIVSIYALLVIDQETMGWTKTN